MSYFYREFAEAYLRSALDTGAAELERLDDEEALVEAAQRHQLDISQFKRLEQLPRVRKTIGVLKSFSPSSLLDIGSGRGAFLWPLLDQLPSIQVTAVDSAEHRVAKINAVGRGGVSHVRALQQDAEHLSFSDNSFDATTVLEVLEHVTNPLALATEAIRVSKTVVLASVPSKEDNNPQHIRLFTPDSLTSLFEEAGASSVRIDHVPNHMIAVIRL